MTPDQEQALRDLRAAYTEWLPQRLASIREIATEALLASGDAAAGFDRARLQRLHHAAQRLSGSSILYGFNAVSETASRLEETLALLLESEAPGREAWAQIGSRLDAVSEALRTELALEAAATASAASDAGWMEMTLEELEDRGEGGRVLLVDDDQDTLNLLALRFSAAGLDVETAHNGNKALQTIQKNAPDVVVADVDMDGMSGFELCRMVRQMGHADLPFIFCSSLAASQTRLSGLRMGADDYLVKSSDTEELLLKVQKWLSRKRSSSAGRGSAAREEVEPARVRPVRPTARKRILIVDDDVDSVAVLRVWLREKGYEVDVVGSGSEALDWIRLDEPDLVILDVVMPILSGLDVCRWMRSNPASSSTPVILLSARNQPSDMIAGEAAGADLYLKKPVHARRLVNLVEMFLSRDVPLLKRTPLSPQPGLERH